MSTAGSTTCPSTVSTCSSTRAAGSWAGEITNIRSCDMVVIAGGRTGTLGELAIAYDEGRLIGVLTGTGGITELVESNISLLARTVIKPPVNSP